MFKNKFGMTALLCVVGATAAFAIAQRGILHPEMTPEMAARPTKVIESIASFTFSARSVATAASRTSARETLNRRTLDDTSIASPRGLLSRSPGARRSGA